MDVETEPWKAPTWKEYPLPCKISDLSSTEGLTPWMKQWIDLDASEIHQILTMEWANVHYPIVARFRDIILKYRPFSLAHQKGVWYLALKRRDEVDEYFDGTVYIESPLQPSVLEKCLVDHDLANHDLMREFYRHFNGLRDRPGYAGNFERPAEWRSLRDLEWDENEFLDEYQSMSSEWLDDPILYTTLGGDMVVRHADDQTAWILMSEHKIIPIASSFSGFLDVCVEAYDKYFLLDYSHLN